MEDMIETILEFHEYHYWVNQLAVSEETWTFRGQRESKWPLECGATRRLNLSRAFVKRNPEDKEIFAYYHRDRLIEPAKRQGLAIEEGRELGDLELLTKLQLLGAATLLLDFTRNSLVALWFACQEKEGAEGSDGRVFAINIADKSKFRELSARQALSVDNLSTLLGNSGDKDRNSMSWYWTPNLTGETAPRILRQHSLFVFGQVEFPEGLAKSAVIPAEKKLGFLDILDRQHDISQESLFKDLYGFALTNNHKSKTSTIRTFDMHVREGVEKFNLKNFEAAIQDFSEAAHLRASNADSYFLSAHAKFEWSLSISESPQFEDALRDYSSALNRLEPSNTISNNGNTASQNPSYFRNFPRILFGQSNAFAMLGRWSKAVSGFSRCIDSSSEPFLINAARLNYANSLFKIGQLDSASKEYMKVISLGTNPPGSNLLRNAYFNLGNTYVLLKQYQNALEQYDYALKLDPEWSDAWKNKSALVAQTGELSAALQLVCERDIQDQNRKTIESALKGLQEPVSLLFIGNSGNTGNFAPVLPFRGKEDVMKGGKGLPGDWGFTLTLE